MQLNPCYLYSNVVEVYTNLDTWPIEGYNKVYQRPFKIYKGVDNRLDFQIKNRDQKSKSIQGRLLYFNMLTLDYKPVKTELISRLCETEDADKGRYFVVLTKEDLENLIYGSYYFSLYITADDSTEERTPLYGDSQFSVIGTINLIANVFPDVVPDVEPNLKATLLGDFYYSDVFSAFDDITDHDFVITSDDYSGTVTIQATKESTTEPSEWIDVLPITVIPQDTVRNVSITGEWTQFRIKHGKDNSGTAKFTVGQNNNQIYSVSVYDGGRNYSAGEIITIIGSALGGADGVNDLTITVTAVNYAGSIISVSSSGTSIVGVRSFVLEGTGLPNAGSITKIAYVYPNLS